MIDGYCWKKQVEIVVDETPTKRFTGFAVFGHSSYIGYRVFAIKENGLSELKFAGNDFLKACYIYNRME